MARIRSIKPEFFRHEALFEAEQETGLPLRVAYAGLWTACDREGRFIWAPRQLKLDCLPYDEVDFARVLDALWTRGFVVKYAVDGKEYGCVPSWNDHQIVNNREADSRLPGPNENNTLTRDARVGDASVTPLCNYQGEGKGKEGKGTDVGTRDASVDVAFESFKRAYPSRGDAPQPWKPAKEKFRRALGRGVDPETIIGAASGYRSYAQRVGILGTEKVAQAVTWLNQERWEQQGAAAPGDQVDWETRVREFRETNGDRWWIKLGPEPGYAGCKAPREVLVRYGYASNEPSAA